MGWRRKVAVVLVGVPAIAVVAAVTGWLALRPYNYEDCVLAHVGKGTQTGAAQIIARACENKSKQQRQRSASVAQWWDELGTPAPEAHNPFADIPAALRRPTDPTDIKAWANYLKQIVEDNLGTISNPPYVYYVPSAQTPADAATITRVQEQVTNMVLGTVLPGNMVAVGGPSSAATAQVMETAFKDAAPDSFKGVVVLFVGDKADETAVKEAVAPSGATFKFAQM